VTVGTQVRQALANAKSVQANLETFALQTKDEMAKEKYAKAATQIQEVIDGLETRMEQIEQEEPSFKMDSEV
jgi:predicted RecB family endonuclease